MIENLTKEDWDGQRGGSFDLVGEEGGAIALTLAEVSGLGTGIGGRRAPYSLIFRGPIRPILPQRIYRLCQPVMGEIDLFLVPIGPDGEGMRYEAVFT
jgi:hypothetical protein